MTPAKTDLERALLVYKNHNAELVQNLIVVYSYRGIQLSWYTAIVVYSYSKNLEVKPRPKAHIP